MIEYNIIRSARKSVSIIVSPENFVTVRCPRNYPESKIRDFLQSKGEWLENVIKINNLNYERNKDIFEYKGILICGKKIPLIFSDRNEVSNEAVYVKDVSRVKKLIINNFKEDFLSYAFSISEQMGIKPSAISLKAYKSKWGCCDRTGKITLNYLLIMLPKDLQRYVIIHELCHTVCFNHSKLFWQLVASYEPNYKTERKQLKSYNFITGLYK